MQRRTLLRRTGAAALLALAGCTSNPDAGGPGDGSGSPDDAGEPDGDAGETDAEPAPTEGEPDGSDGAAVVDTAFEVRDVTSGTRVDRADVAFDAESNRVRIEGTIPGANGCKTAVLGPVGYDEAADEVTVPVATTDREGTGDRACTQAIVEISYEATVGVDGGLPASVVVRHDGRTVTAARRDGADGATATATDAQLYHSSGGR